jgi:hypothetical protein
LKKTTNIEENFIKESIKSTPRMIEDQNSTLETIIQIRNTKAMVVVTCDNVGNQKIKPSNYSKKS